MRVFARLRVSPRLSLLTMCTYALTGVVLLLLRRITQKTAKPDALRLTASVVKRFAFEGSRTKTKAFGFSTTPPETLSPTSERFSV